MQKDGAGAGGAVRGELLATICRGAFNAHLHPVEPGARKRVGSVRAAIANGSLARREPGIDGAPRVNSFTFSLKERGCRKDSIVQLFLHSLSGPRVSERPTHSM